MNLMEIRNIEHKIILRIAIWKTNFDIVLLAAVIMNEVPELCLS